MGLFKALASLPKMLRWNKDPKQQKLASLFAVAGESDPQMAAQTAVVIEDFIKQERWSRSEAADRIAHALSLEKVLVTWNPDIVEKAQLVGDELIRELTGKTHDAGRAGMKAEYGTEQLAPEKQKVIGEAIEALVEAHGVRTYHSAIGILMLTITYWMKQLPPSNHKEQMKQAMLRWVQGL
jgi:hypothetical protein